MRCHAQLIEFPILCCAAPNKCLVKARRHRRVRSWKQPEISFKPLSKNKGPLPAMPNNSSVAGPGTSRTGVRLYSTSSEYSSSPTPPRLASLTEPFTSVASPAARRVLNIPPLQTKELRGMESRSLQSLMRSRFSGKAFQRWLKQQLVGRWSFGNPSEARVVTKPLQHEYNTTRPHLKRSS